MQVQAIEKIRRPDGRVVGFHEQATGRIREMFDGGATRQRRLKVLTRKLWLFAIGEIRDPRGHLETETLAKVHEAIGLLDKAGELIGRHDTHYGARYDQVV